MENGIGNVIEAKEKEFILEVKNYDWTVRLIFILDFLIALLILFLSNNLIETEFGRASLVFGFIMLVIVTLLGILRKFS